MRSKSEKRTAAQLARIARNHMAYGPGDGIGAYPPEPYSAVITALQKLMRSVPGDDARCTKGRAICYEVLALYGRGAKGVRLLERVYYDDVIRGCAIEEERIRLGKDHRPHIDIDHLTRVAAKAVDKELLALTGSFKGPDVAVAYEVHVTITTSLAVPQ